MDRLDFEMFHYDAFGYLPFYDHGRGRYESDKAQERWELWQRSKRAQKPR